MVTARILFQADNEELYSLEMKSEIQLYVETWNIMDAMSSYNKEGDV